MIAALWVGLPLLLAQAPTFDVATIRAASPESRGTSINNDRGRVTIRNATLSTLIEYAYDVRPFQIEGAPEWARGDRFDLVATHDVAGETRDQRDVNARLRMRALLAERFQLTVRETKKEMAALALRQEKGGHKMKANAQGAGSTNINSNQGNAVMRANGVTMQSLAGSLGGFARRPVLDETGLAGTFDFQLEWSSAEAGPSLPTALKEQLGLRLEATRAPVPVFVVERVEKPSTN